MKVTILSTFLVAFSGLVPSARAADDRYYPDIFVTIVNDPTDSVPPTPHGVVYLGFRNNMANTLVSIPFDKGHSGRTCSLSFQGQVRADGARGVEIYSVGQISKSNTWNSRPKRGQRWGTFDVNPDGDQTATNWRPGKPTFPCPDGPTRLEFELGVAGNEYMDLDWNPGSGLYITAE